jgi:tripartite-type tricarboxylate transporter receptor subunit TctC
MPRHDRVLTVAFCALGLMATHASSEISVSCKSAMKGQRLTVIVPNAAGGGYDTYGRALAPVMDELSGVRSSVINMPAAGGLVALTALSESGTEELVVLVENGTDVLRSSAPAGATPWIERLEPIGVFHAEPSAWVGKSDLAFMDAKSLVAAASSADGKFEFDLVGQSIGKEVKLISGYGGSKETEAAVLRGDADLLSGSLTTSLKAAKSGDLALKLVLSDTPSDRAPGIPHLAGENGLAAELAKDLAPEERARRIEMAGLVASLSYDVRTVFTHKTLRADLLGCLAEAVGDAIRSPAFSAAAEAQGRPVTPMDPAEAKAMLNLQKASLARLSAMSATP